MGDFLVFRRMLLPVLIQIIFWLLVLASIAAGVFLLVDYTPPWGPAEEVMKEVGKLKDHPLVTSMGLSGEAASAVVGLVLCLVGPLVIRLVCELLIIPFTINGTLTGIRNAQLELKDAAERQAAGHVGVPAVAARPVQ